MTYSYSLSSTSFNTETKKIQYTWTYSAPTGTLPPFGIFNGTEQQLQDYLSQL